jgi:Uma2 family endonuclease
MAGAGVREAWLIAPRRRQVEVHDLEIGARTVHGPGETAASLTLAGFTLELDTLFAAPG